ncbi:MAG: MotA/TolQ/ExbB proton channel family protein [Acidobacteriota bacterium]|nr:MotA/TolQ/ExbB proton channel family protein [Acidobacteriota bacterium]
MNLLGTLENGLFALSQVLRLPVIVLLWVCVLSAFFLAGGCVAEYLTRRRERRGFDLDRWLDQGPVLSADTARLEQLPATLLSLVGAVTGRLGDPGFRHGGLERVLLEHEATVERRLNGSRLLVRVGPSLGLLGTLIPMGAALASLTAGDLEAMASQMVVAFTTTVIGLATGTAAFAVLVARRGWVAETTLELRFLAERMNAELGAVEE